MKLLKLNIFVTQFNNFFQGSISLRAFNRKCCLQMLEETEQAVDPSRVFIAESFLSLQERLCWGRTQKKLKGHQ